MFDLDAKVVKVFSSYCRLDEIGALRLTRLTKNHETWRLFTGLWLHAGVFHLLINLSCVIFIGIHLEQEFGPRNLSFLS